MKIAIMLIVSVTKFNADFKEIQLKGRNLFEIDISESDNAIRYSSIPPKVKL